MKTKRGLSILILWRGFCVALLGIFILGVGIPAKAQPNVFQVAAGDVPGLIAAINTANDEVAHPGPDTIILAGGTYTLTEANPLGGPDGPTGLPSITSEIVLEGNGATIDRPAHTPALFRILHVAKGGDLTLSQVTISGGFTGNDATLPPVLTFYPGGGIYNAGSLTIAYSSIVDNGHEMERRVPPSSYALKMNFAQMGPGAGIYNTGTLIIYGSEIAFNKGNYAPTPVGGGIYNDGGTVLVNTSSISNNYSGAGSGVYNKAGGEVKLLNTLLAGNRSRFFGAAFDNEGDGLIVNSTVSDNNDAVFNIGQLSIINSTLANGIKWRAAGGITNWDYLGATASLINTILSNNQGNCSGKITSLGHNLDSDGTCGLVGPGDLSNVDPLLGPLQDNGGETLTHALLPGSPAIDAADPPACPSKDQRGIRRPQGKRCDMGSYELAIKLITPVRVTADVNSLDAPKTIDKNPYEFTALTTYWQAAGDPEACITYDMGKVTPLIGFRETSSIFPGNPFTAYTSVDGKTYDEVASGILTEGEYGYHYFALVSAKFIKLCIQRTGATGYGELADFRSIGLAKP